MSVLKKARAHKKTRHVKDVKNDSTQSTQKNERT